jgi:Holliday junction resolvasome RuvABC DNA-binding subunit
MTSTNQEIAQRLGEAAELLEQQGASPFRVNAYRRAASTIDGLRRDLAQLVAQEGQDALEGLPGIGAGIAAAIREMLVSGRWAQLERLRGSSDPVALFTTIPGIGPDLARRIHDSLAVETLEALEAAAHDGRLAAVAGFGPRRLQTVRVGLAQALGRLRVRPAPTSTEHPQVADLLEIDAEYRSQARAGALKRIAPRRFNPSGEAWLPVLHAQRAAWHFTALYSNTARAHELGKTKDWVVVYYYDDDHVEGQCTVVTETSGHLKGRRVVRGREHECAEHYAARAPDHGAA